MSKITFLILGTIVLCTIGYSQSQGPNNAATFINVALTGSAKAWTNAANAATTNNTRATTTNLGGSGGAYSDYLQLTNFGFSIPTNATILGIVVAVERDDPNGNTIDNAVRIVKGNVIGSTDKSLAAAWPTTDAYQSYGTSTDLWGETWTPADINSVNFGFAISARKLAGGAQNGRIDHIQVTVHYSLTLPVNITHFSVSGNAQSVIVNWKSDSEKNLSHYEIERSANGIDFASIGRTPAQQKGIEAVYSFSDNQPIKGNAYYRLKAVDLDNQFKYSAIAAVTFKQTGKIQVYPNPLPKGQSLFITNSSNEEITVKLFSPAGALLESITTSKNNIALTSTNKTNGPVIYSITNKTGKQLSVGQLILY
jgi:hypothetical protein